MVSSFFFSTPNLGGHSTDLNQTWTHIHLWLLFEKVGRNHGRRVRNLKLRGATWGQWPGNRGQEKSLWVYKMSTRGHLPEPTFRLGATGGGKGKVTGGSCPLFPLAPPMVWTHPGFTPMDLSKPTFKIDRTYLCNGTWYQQSERNLSIYRAWGRCSVGQVGHGPPKILVGWATMHLAPPILACTFLNSTPKSIRLTMQPVCK